jgi:sporulation-control protein spo0M
MKKEYDFTDAEQGKFYRPIEELEIPIYLDKDVQKFLMKYVDKDNSSLSELVNSLVKKDIEISKKLAS